MRQGLLFFYFLVDDVVFDFFIPTNTNPILPFFMWSWWARRCCPVWAQRIGQDGPCTLAGARDPQAVQVPLGALRRPRAQGKWMGGQPMGSVKDRWVFVVVVVVVVVVYFFVFFVLVANASVIEFFIWMLILL
jgi:hypothetical protein